MNSPAMSISIRSFGHLFIHISLLGTYQGVEPMGHRVFECSAWVDTDNNFLKSFQVHTPTGRVWKLQLLRIFPILGIDRLTLAMLVGVLGFKYFFAVLKKKKLINLFIFGCIGSSLLHVGFL